MDTNDTIPEYDARANDMPWAIGRMLGHYCGFAECKNEPAPYSEMCRDHRGPHVPQWVERLAVNAKELGR